MHYAWVVNRPFTFKGRVQLLGLRGRAPSLPMLLLVSLDSGQFIGARGAEAPLLVDVDDLGLLDMHDHIGLVVALDISKAERHRHQVLPVPIQLRAEIDAGFGGITSWELDDLDAPMQVERDKMAGRTRRFVVADVGVNLEGARAAIVEIVPGGVPPADDEGEARPQCQHDNHAESQVEYWMAAPVRFPSDASRLTRG